MIMLVRNGRVPVQRAADRSSQDLRGPGRDRDRETRLFEEVQARTRELQESLEYQTATSEVLSVISRSPSRSSRCFDTIVETRGGYVRPICARDFGFVTASTIVAAAQPNDPA